MQGQEKGLKHGAYQWYGRGNVSNAAAAAAELHLWDKFYSMWGIGSPPGQCKFFEGSRWWGWVVGRTSSCWDLKDKRQGEHADCSLPVWSRMGWRGLCSCVVATEWCCFWHFCSSMAAWWGWQLQAVAGCSAYRSIKEKLDRQQLQRNLSRGRSKVPQSCSSLSSQGTVLSLESVSQRGSYWDYTPSFQPDRAFAAVPVSISMSGLCRVEAMLDPGAWLSAKSHCVLLKMEPNVRVKNVSGLWAGMETL